MKEVNLKRYAGPFKKVPFESFIQSPVGLVPKAGMKDATRLIFHLSYDFREGDKQLVNYFTPDEICSVHYNDLDHEIGNCLEIKRRYGNRADCQDEDGNFVIFFGKTDLRSAFRFAPLKPGQFRWMILKAVDPETGETFFFIDKCLPFGSSRSCAIFELS